MEYGIFGLLILVLDIFAIVKTLDSNSDTATKVVWTLVILFLPVVGLIAWWFIGPRGS